MITKLNSNSRYLKGGRADILQDKIGWWDRTIFDKSVDDVQLLIGSKYHKRPHLVAFDIYGKSELMWFILQYNNIIDVNTEFVNGVTITLPLPRRVQLNLL